CRQRCVACRARASFVAVAVAAEGAVVQFGDVRLLGCELQRTTKERARHHEVERHERLTLAQHACVALAHVSGRRCRGYGRAAVHGCPRPREKIAEICGRSRIRAARWWSGHAKPRGGMVTSAW